MAIVVQRRVNDHCNGSIDSKNCTDLEYILEVIFDPGTWRYTNTITESGKTRKRRDLGRGQCNEGRGSEAWN